MPPPLRRLAMMRSIRLALAAVAAVSLLLAPGPGARAQEAGNAASSLSKPLADFRIGDIFPRVVDDTFRQTGAAWREASRGLLEQAAKRADEVSDTERQ